MTILECFETEAFNELINFSFEEVRAVFNLNIYFVSDDNGEAFISEAVRVKSWYSDELNKIESYAQGEYTDRLNAGEDVPEFEEPGYKINTVEVNTKRKLINILTKYFDRELFQQNKRYIYGQDFFKEEAVETPHELRVSLHMHKDKIYTLLSMIGYYQRHCGYFLSQADFLSICFKYSHEVYAMNKQLGMKYEFRNIFISSGRIKTIEKTPRKKKSDNTSDENNDDFLKEQKKKHKYIDIDKISLLMLIEPYLKHNTREITKIMEIMTTNFRYGGSGTAWESAMEEVNAFIAECEAKGIMKRL